MEADESVLSPPKAHTLQQNLLQSVDSGLPGDGRKQLTQRQQKHSEDCGQTHCKQGGGRTLRFSVADPLECLENHTIGTVPQQVRAVCPVLKLYMYLR